MATDSVSPAANYSGRVDLIAISYGVMHSSFDRPSDTYVQVSSALRSHSSIAVGQADSMLLIYVDRPSQLYDASLPLDYIDHPSYLNNACFLVSTVSESSVSTGQDGLILLYFIDRPFQIHSFKFPSCHYCSLIPARRDDSLLLDCIDRPHHLPAGEESPLPDYINRPTHSDDAYFQVSALSSWQSSIHVGKDELLSLDFTDRYSHIYYVFPRFAIASSSHYLPSSRQGN